MNDPMLINLIQAFGWTLIHSIWQILVIGIILRLLLLLFKDQSSNTNYLLSFSAYTLILIVSLFTFIGYFNDGNGLSVSDRIIASTEFSGILSSGQPAQMESTIDSNQSLLSMAVFFLSSNIHFIVGIWFCGLIILYIRFAGNYWYVQRLKSRNLIPLIGEWNSKLKELKHKIRVNKYIRIAESTAIQIPMVIGHLKPVILLPIGMLNALPVNQIEAIILHELAHIKRNDYFVNLIKSFIDIIYFYHPMIWWISGKIDNERENCCDDLTIMSIKEPDILQQALVTIHDKQINAKGILNGKSTYIAAALFKNNHQLLKRIKRMKTQNLTKRNKFSGLAGILILLISVAILTTFSAFSPSASDLPLNYQKIDIPESELVLTSTTPSFKSEGNHKSTQQHNLLISVPDSTKKVNNEKDTDADKDKDVDLDIEKRIQKELKAAEKEMAKAEIEVDKAMKVYEEAMNQYQNQLSEALNSEDMEARLIAEKEYEKAMALAELQLKNIDMAIPEIDELGLAEILEDQLETLKELSLEQHNEISDQMLAEAIELQKLEQEILSTEMQDRLSTIGDELNLQLEELEDVLADQIEAIEGVKKLEFDAQLLETTIRSELIEDNVIENKKDDLSFLLSAKKLEVNGQTLSNKLHQKYLKLYEEITNDKLEGTTKLIFQD